MQEQKEAGGHLWALDLRRDFEGLSKLIETAFAEDFQRIGVQFQEELKAIRRLVPWVLLLGRFSKFFRELLGGYVSGISRRSQPTLIIVAGGSPAA